MGVINPDRSAKVMKGVANPHRIRILLTLQQTPGQSLNELTDKLKINFRTTSEHTKKLVTAGLVLKRYKSTSVIHTLTPLGQKTLKVLQQLN